MWRWGAQGEIDGGDARGVAIEENEEVHRLGAENRRLREDVAILKAATTFFAGKLAPRNGCWSPSSTSSVHLTVLTDRVAGCTLVTGRRSAPPTVRNYAMPEPRAAHPGGLAAGVE